MRDGIPCPSPACFGIGSTDGWIWARPVVVVVVVVVVIVIESHNPLQRFLDYDNDYRFADNDYEDTKLLLMQV